MDLTTRALSKIQTERGIIFVSLIIKSLKDLNFLMKSDSDQFLID